ncbi:MAG: hypothetical protein HY904_20355 [Deltaproteobacteria bacterium]|nr:hypothetical protein [Deltaproteobacteria bacterium]
MSGRAAAVALVAALAAGCAYGFTYGGGAPGEPRTRAVRVEPLADLTAEGWVASVVTDRLRARLGGPPDGAVLALTGEVGPVSMSNVPVARPGGVSAGLAVVKVRARVRLVDAAGRVVVDGVEREGSAELVVAQTVSETEDMRRLALERAARALADELAEAVEAAAR